MSVFLAQVGRALRFAGRVLWSPVRIMVSLRRSMTGASVTMLLVAIITLNIVWGYPWTGMFAAAVSTMFVGWIANRIMRPRLNLGFSLPQSSPAREPFAITLHLGNRSRLPAIDLEFWFGRAGRRARSLINQPLGKSGFRSHAALEPIEVIHASEHAELSATISFDRRGVHPLPDVLVASGFPFRLFDVTTKLASSDTWIAITPQLISGEEDSLSREMLTALGGWSHRLRAGDALDYTGSREYQSGMPVRRWDFASWARLGRPIVREFQSPSVQAVTLIVDTSVTSKKRMDDAEEESIERVLSLAATAIGQLSRQMVCVRMYVTCEDPTILTHGDASVSVATDSESLLIRLASAEIIDHGEVDPKVTTVLEYLSQTPVLVLTTRDDASVWQQLPENVTVMRVDMAHRSVSTINGGPRGETRNRGTESLSPGGV